MPRPVHFEIHAENPERAMTFYRTLLGWKFEQSGEEPYWLITTGEKGTPGIDGGLMPRRGAGPDDMQAVNSFISTVDVPDVDAYMKRVSELGGTTRGHDCAAEDARADRWLVVLRQGHRREFVRPDAVRRQRQVAVAAGGGVAAFIACRRGGRRAARQ